VVTTALIHLQGEAHRCRTQVPHIKGKYRPTAYENWVLRNVFQPTGEEVTRDWQRLHNELQVYSSPIITQVIDSRSGHDMWLA
jgi:hypothetical protein